MADTLPIAIIGAGPVGLAAAAHLVERGLTPLILERGDSVGATLLDWAHVRVFSPWSYDIDAAARRLLEGTGWSAPNPRALPTGGEIVRRYLAPLAAHPAIAPHLVLGATAVSVARAGLDKLTSAGRAAAPFSVAWRDRAGEEHRTPARAVIDASGTWGTPNPIGVDGRPVPGEDEAGELVATGIPDVAGQERARYAGATVLVVGAGHSAINVVLDLVRLQETAPGTRILWALRRDRAAGLRGGGAGDQLPARGALGLAAERVIADGRVEVLAPFAAARIERRAGGLLVSGTLRGAPIALAVDRIVVATGFRPDLALLRELRVVLDPATEAPPALAPLIDPNVHSCGTVPPHGARELAHPEEPGVYVVGAKSYGRAPTFLMATGYEQVRSVVAEIAGDHAAARDVRLVLPETGVCSATPVGAEPASAGCCGGPAPAAVDACCLADATAKAAGGDGCGCAAEADRAISIAAAPAGSSCCGAGR